MHTRFRHRRKPTFDGALLGGLALALCGAAWAQGPPINSKAQQAAPTAFAAADPRPLLSWGAGDGKSYLVPALDILGFDFLLNQFDRNLLDRKVYGSDASSFSHNLTHSWVVDDDPFAINQFGHPYQGSIYHGFARSAGLDYWTSAAYTVGGSLLWELAGETDPPSINDQFTTGIGGSLLGEPLFRMASLLLESRPGRRPNRWREIGAAALSPSLGFNRWAHGERFDGVFRSQDPAVFTRLALGANLNGRVKTNVTIPGADGAEPTPQSFQRGEGAADFTIAYGLPGKPGYRYDRPFDYFHFQFTATSASIFENVISRGLLYGSDYARGDNYRGVWGLYGNYDYIAPQIFRVSSTGVGLGSTGQLWLSKRWAYQGTALAGAGYGSAGSIRGAGDRDYHNGITPQALLASRLIFSDRAALELELRDYYVSGLASKETGGSENIARAEASLTLRVYKLHGIALKYAYSQRDAHYPDLPNTHQSVAAISLGYSYLGQTRFGAVDWRPKQDGGP
ncbi:MAG: DUF3943 domain-containing protein [Stagnimonas sp.]|nr:DUF3943 domain-containing protein [Stagnimonas sp.]